MPNPKDSFENNLDLPIREKVKLLYHNYGSGKPMGMSAENPSRPHFFLHRKFLDEQDLLIIFNTKRCRYKCNFCNLPSKSSKSLVSSENILSQFEYVMNELKHSLSVIDRFTISNEGSVLDTSTFPEEAMTKIVSCSTELKNLRTLVLETRLEFADPAYITSLATINPRVRIDILTGFETLSSVIRADILGKKEPIEVFLKGLDFICHIPISLTCYILYKPSPYMTDEEAKIEAERSIFFLQNECSQRGIPLTIRINPMYAAQTTKWADMAYENVNYLPPKLSDILTLARQLREQGLRIYIGLSTEGLEFLTGTYRNREDFSKDLLKQAIEFNLRY